MRFRLGLLTGLGVGYYLGAKAGRDRYEQLNQMLERARHSEAYETATGKAKAVVDLTVERARDFVDERSGADDDRYATATTAPGTGVPGTGVPGAGGTA